MANHTAQSLITTALILCFLDSASFAQDKMTAEVLVARHLEAIGSKEARASIKNRQVSGPVTQSRSSFTLRGELSATMTSSGAKFRYTLHSNRFPDPTNDLVVLFDGARLVPDFTHGGYVPSPVPDFRHIISGYYGFLSEFPMPLKEGLFGGVLSTAWPFPRMEEQKPHLEYRGVKKVRGRQLHSMEYRAGEGSKQVKVQLFFDPTTFQHIRTEYKVDRIIGYNDEHYVLIEEFSDFRAVDDLSLPHNYRIQFTGENTPTEWSLSVEKIFHNQPVDNILFQKK